MKVYVVGKRYRIKLGSYRRPQDAIEKGTCVLLAIRRVILENISEDFAKFDADCSKSELAGQLQKWYGEDYYDKEYQILVLLKANRQETR